MNVIKMICYSAESSVASLIAGFIGNVDVVSSRRRHTRCSRDWSSDVCSSDLRGDRFADQGAQTVDFLRRVLKILLGVDLEVVALNEERPGVPLADCGRDHDRGVFTGALLAVT